MELRRKRANVRDLEERGRKAQVCSREKSMFRKQGGGLGVGYEREGGRGRKERQRRQVESFVFGIFT